MVSAITNIFYLFQDVGLTDATIQASEINHIQISTLFWINLGFSFLITFVLMASAPLIAVFYNRSELTLIMMISAFNFVFWGLTTQHVALLKRNMQFVKVGFIELASNSVSTIVAIGLALIGWRYWAIVLRDIIYGVIKWLLVWAACRWRPGRPRRNAGVRPFLRFGINSVGFYIVNYFANNADKAIVGKTQGAEALGFYSRAYYLSTSLSGQLAFSIFHVAVSTLSRLRDDPLKYRKYYFNAIWVISFIGMPASVYLLLMSKEIILFLLGPQWGKAAEIFSVLGISAGINILYSTNGWLHVSLGRSDRWMRWGVVSSLIIVFGFIIGSPFGIRGIAIAYTVTTIALTIPGLLYAGSPIGLKLREILSPIWKAVISAIFSGALFGIIKSTLMPELGIFIDLTVTMVMFICIYLIFIIIIHRGIRPLRELISVFKLTFIKRSA